MNLVLTFLLLLCGFLGGLLLVYLVAFFLVYDVLELFARVPPRHSRCGGM